MVKLSFQRLLFIWQKVPLFIFLVHCAAGKNKSDIVTRNLKQLYDLQVPDFFVIGAMKCGTTSLNKLMKVHPEICNEGKKEKHFFDRPTYNRTEEMEAYLSEYEKCSEGLMTMDSTPAYIQIKEVPSRLQESYTAENLRKKKFVLILRDPVARQYSEYQMRIRVCLDHGEIKGLRQKRASDDEAHQEERGFFSCDRVCHNYKPGIDADELDMMTFAQWLKAVDGNWEKSRGHYLEHIKNWLEVVGRDQLFIINFQSLIYDTPDIMTRMSKFLGLKKSWGDDAELPEPKKKKPKTFLDCASYDALTEHYAEVNEGLVDFINNAKDKPEDEPDFPPFNGNRSVCQEHDPFA